MKKVITLSLFILLLLIVMAGKSLAQTQVVMPTVVRPAMPANRIGGYWHWNRRLHQYVWVTYRPAPHFHRVKISRMRW